MKRKRNLYFINAIGNAEDPTKSRSYCEWHQIMGHLNYASMMKMPKFVEGMIMTGKAPKQCLTCIKNKSKMLRNRKADERATKPFQFVHSDVHQPDNLTFQAIGGYKYIASFIDDWSGFMTIYPIKSKDEVAAKFKDFITFTKTPWCHREG